jgi:hypothetical protein
VANLPLEIVNTIITGNDAQDSGGALWWIDSFGQLLNSTIYGNSAGRGGGVFGEADTFVDTFRLANTILWNNEAVSAGGSQIGLALGGFGLGTMDTLVVEACDVGGGLGGVLVVDPGVWTVDWHATNIDVDPAFADPRGAGDGDFSLLAGSPCIDTGLDRAVPPDTFDLDGDGDTTELLPVDLSGAARIVAGSCEMGAPPRVDMGALESQPQCCPADLDGNGSVGFPDLVRLLFAWGPCTGCAADIDGSGDVGFTDLELLIASWGPC